MAWVCATCPLCLVPVVPGPMTGSTFSSRLRRNGHISRQFQRSASCHGYHDHFRPKVLPSGSTNFSGFRRSYFSQVGNAPRFGISLRVCGFKNELERVRFRCDRAWCSLHPVPCVCPRTKRVCEGVGVCVASFLSIGLHGIEIGIFRWYS